MENTYYRKTSSNLLIASLDTRDFPRTPIDSGCCNLHWMPAGGKCDDYQADDGGGILIENCSNCWYFNDRQLKYHKIEEMKLI